MKTLTITVNENGSLNIQAPDMNAYEVLGVLKGAESIMLSPEPVKPQAAPKKTTRRKAGN